MATIHNAGEPGQIAKVVLLPGDPLRAKMIAETYLTKVIQFNEVRGMLGYTGCYRGERISVMGGGMGIPSTGIYTHELYWKYDVDTIIRVGSCGAYSEKLNMYDIVLVDSSYSESTYAKTYSGCNDSIVTPSAEVGNLLLKTADGLRIPLHTARVHSTDCFYRMDKEALHQIREEKGCLAVEMESFALFHNAAVAGRNGACMLTVSDHAITHEKASPEERQRCFTQMIQVALEGAAARNQSIEQNICKDGQNANV